MTVYTLFNRLLTVQFVTGPHARPGNRFVAQTLSENSISCGNNAVETISIYIGNYVHVNRWHRSQSNRSATKCESLLKVLNMSLEIYCAFARLRLLASSIAQCMQFLYAHFKGDFVFGLMLKLIQYSSNCLPFTHFTITFV